MNTMGIPQCSVVHELLLDIGDVLPV